MSLLPYRIEAGPVVLRPYAPTDVPEVFRVTHDSALHLEPFMPWVHTLPGDHDGMLELLLGFRGKFDLGQDFTLGVFSREDGHYAGGCGLHPRVGAGGFEIGYWTAQTHLRRGFASSAAAALTRVAFELMEAQRLEIHVDPANVASLAIPARLGYVREGLRRKRQPWLDGELRDSIAFVMVAEDYPASSARAWQTQAYDALERPARLAAVEG